MSTEPERPTSNVMATIIAEAIKAALLRMPEGESPVTAYMPNGLDVWCRSVAEMALVMARDQLPDVERAQDQRSRIARAEQLIATWFQEHEPSDPACDDIGRILRVLIGP